MIHKKIALCCLFLSGQVLCMLVTPAQKTHSKSGVLLRNRQVFPQESIPVTPRIIWNLNHQIFTQNLTPDTLCNVLGKLDFNSTARLLGTCKFLQGTYGDKGFALSPEDYMKNMISASRAGNEAQVRFLMQRESESHKKQRESILQYFKVDCTNLAAVMGIYKKEYDSECEEFIQLKTDVEFEYLVENPLLCRLLLEQGMSPNIGNTTEMYDTGMYDTETLLIAVIKRGNLEGLKLLLGYEKIDPNKETEDVYRKIPLEAAIDIKSSEIIKLLLGHEKIHPNLGREMCPQLPLIHYSIDRGDPETTKCLLESDKVDPNKENYSRKTPLFYVASDLVYNGRERVSDGRKIEILGVLLDHSKVTMKNLFWWDLQYYISRNPDFIKLLSKCTYKTRFLYWCGYILGYMRRVIDNRAAIYYSGGYVEDIIVSIGFPIFLLSLVYLSRLAIPTI